MVDGEHGGGRPTDLVSLGALTTLVPRTVLDEAIAVTEAHEQRVRKLPSHVVVYLLMALCLYADDDYEEVAEKLTGMLSFLSGTCWQPPSRGAITQARQRLGPEPVKEAFLQVASPAATRETPGAFLGRWRVMAVEGFVLDLPDTAANLEEFGRDGAGGGRAVLPQARVVAISECASHAPVAADIAGCWAGEQTIAYSLYEQLTPGMLLTADRGFYGFDSWRQASASGAELLWRISAGLRREHLRDLPDGSWLALITKPRMRAARKDRMRSAAQSGEELDPAEAVVVRVIDYTVPDREGEEVHLLTTILDPDQAAAEDLASRYWHRWEAKSGLDRLRDHLRGPGKVLRSRRPELVYQEIWAYLLTHWALSTLICRASTAAGIDPDRVKFLGAVRIARRSATDRAPLSP